MKTAFVFPGQGSQKVGMLQDLYNAYPIVKQRFEEADEALGYSISKLCFEGPDTELVKTANTQPAILTASVACSEILKGIRDFNGPSLLHSSSLFNRVLALSGCYD